MKILFCSGNIEDELNSINVLIEANGDVYDGEDIVARANNGYRYRISSSAMEAHPELMELYYDCIRIKY